MRLRRPSPPSEEGSVVFEFGNAAANQKQAGNQDSEKRAHMGLLVKCDEYPPKAWQLNWLGEPADKNEFDRSFRAMTQGCDLGAEWWLETLTTNKPSADQSGFSMLALSQPKTLLQYVGLLNKGSIQGRVRKFKNVPSSHPHPHHTRVCMYGLLALGARARV